jgi:hypothetical protein
VIAFDVCHVWWLYPLVLRLELETPLGNAGAGALASVALDRETLRICRLVCSCMDRWYVERSVGGGGDEVEMEYC